MTVAELIEQLKGLPAESEVIIQKDSEGNDYSPLYGLEQGGYVAETTWSGYRSPGHGSVVFLMPVN